MHILENILGALMVLVFFVLIPLAFYLYCRDWNRESTIRHLQWMRDTKKNHLTWLKWSNEQHPHRFDERIQEEEAELQQIEQALREKGA